MKTYPNPYNLPENVLAVTHQFQTCEYASISGKGEPITYPMLPFVSPDGRTFDVATGLTYPAKAERARRNPKVALLYSYPRGSKLADTPTVLVVGRAAVRDQDLQDNTNRYINGLKERGGLLPFPTFMQGLFGWYYTLNAGMRHLTRPIPNLILPHRANSPRAGKMPPPTGANVPIMRLKISVHPFSRCWIVKAIRRCAVSKACP
jgi:hypothetical protein